MPQCTLGEKTVLHLTKLPAQGILCMASLWLHGRYCMAHNTIGSPSSEESLFRVFS